MALLLVKTGTTPMTVETDLLSPLALALAQCLHERLDIVLRSVHTRDQMLAAMSPARRARREEEMEVYGRPDGEGWDEMPVRGWAPKPSPEGYTKTPQEWLEESAAKLPIGYVPSHPLGSTDGPVPAFQDALAFLIAHVARYEITQTIASMPPGVWSDAAHKGAAPAPVARYAHVEWWDRQEIRAWSQVQLSRDQVVELTAKLKIPMTTRTWSSYVSRGRAPKATTYVGRTPLWTPATVIAWASTREGQGARTDLRTFEAPYWAQGGEVFDTPAPSEGSFVIGPNSGGEAWLDQLARRPLGESE